MGLRFGIDIDGVLADFIASVVTIANQLWPGRLPIGYVPSDWNYSDVFSKDDWKRVWEEIVKTPNFWFNANCLSGATDLVDFLISAYPPAEVVFITQRMDTGGISAKEQTRNWLISRVLFSDAYDKLYTVKDAAEKAKILEDNRIQYYLDDYAPTIDGLQKTHPYIKAYLLDAPWNRYMLDLPRLYSVKEYLQIVKDGYENN
jgi:5'(3')-deoxyribonucleotidase